MLHGSPGLVAALIGLTVGSSALAQPAQPFSQHFAISEDGARIAYYVDEDAPETTPLIVVSGGPGSDHRYLHAGGAFEQLAERRRVVMYDQRATGASAPAPATPSIDQWVADIEAIRAELGAERIDLLGHSFGGYLAMSYADAHADHARSLILVDSTRADLTANVQLIDEIYPERAAEWRELRPELPDTFPPSTIAVFLSMEFVDPDWFARYLDHVEGLTYDISVNNALRADMVGRDLAARLPEIEAPSLVLHGRFDAILAVSNSLALHRALPNSRLQIFERSGHQPYHEEAELFSERVDAFLSEVDSGL